jgi:hypothetical protein
MIHSRSGRQAGLTTDDIRDLIELDPAKYDHRAWVALAWARDWTLFDGEFPDPDLVADFEANYSEQERRDILAVVTVMSFANKWNNTTTGLVLDEDDVGR